MKDFRAARGINNHDTVALAEERAECRIRGRIHHRHRRTNGGDGHARDGDVHALSPRRRITVRQYCPTAPWDTLNSIKHFTPVRRRSEEHTSELQSLMRISYAVFCLKKKRK